ncbi:MAG: tRNA pseudouridine(55) synthase TruB [Bdellovibrio sp.]|nr:MAG: tRNA pseudouridine(55) synthase TruB [Bdellovibrio sp.]
MKHGLLLIDKPKGMTSHSLVNKVRKILGTKAVGHAGTLDPIASGLMVLLVGEGTKLSQYMMSQDKGYEVEILWGKTTDTFDRDGEVLSERDVNLSEERVREVLNLFQGTLSLQVPYFSAMKINGRKLYEMARNKEVFTPPYKEMHFYGVQLLSHEGAITKVSVKCSKGSYVRSWVHEMGQKLGCGAIIHELRRVESSPYHVRQAVTLEDLQAGQGESSFIPLVEALPHWKTLSVKGKDARLLRNGQISHDLFQKLIVEQKQANQRQETIGIKITSQEGRELLSILEARPFKGLKIKRVFNVPV